MFRFFFLLVSLPFLNLIAREPIIFCAVEKSASVYIGTKLYQGLDMPLMTITNSDDWPMHGYIVPEKLENFVCAQGFVREHLLPTSDNISLLKNHQLKMVFHVRDLRQRVVSHANYHFHLASQGNKKIMDLYHKIGLDVEHWRLKDFIEYFILRTPEYVNRIQGWLSVDRQGIFPMLITTYEEFLDNEEEFFRKILAFYDIPDEEFKVTYVPKDSTSKFRNGTKNEWREALTLEQQERINSMIPKEFFDFFHWEH